MVKFMLNEMLYIQRFAVPFRVLWIPLDADGLARSVSKFGAGGRQLPGFRNCMVPAHDMCTPSADCNATATARCGTASPRRGASTGGALSSGASLHQCEVVMHVGASAPAKFARRAHRLRRAPLPRSEKAYNAMALVKWDITAQLLAMGYDVLILDPDLALLRNPLPYLETLGSCDIMSQVDSLLDPTGTLASPGIITFPRAGLAKWMREEQQRGS